MGTRESIIIVIIICTKAFSNDRLDCHQALVIREIMKFLEFSALLCHSLWIATVSSVKPVAQDLRTVSGGLDIDRYEDILIYRDTQKVDNIFVSLDFTILPKTCFLVQPAPCKTISIKVYHAMGAEYDLLHALCYSLFEAGNVKKCARPPTTLGV